MEVSRAFFVASQGRGLIDVMGSITLTSVINGLNMAVDCNKIVRLSWLSSDVVSDC